MPINPEFPRVRMQQMLDDGDAGIVISHGGLESKILDLDVDIVNLVNLKFMTKHYGYSPHKIIKMRANGEKFSKIGHKIKGGKNAKSSKSHSKKSKGKSKSKGKKK